jgi:hypothetical protein
VKLTIDGSDLLNTTIADISEAGCGFRTDRAIEPGQRVVIEDTGFEGGVLCATATRTPALSA